MLFLFNIFFLPKKKNKRCERNTENSNPIGFELHRLLIKNTKLMFKLVKAVIIIAAPIRHWYSFAYFYFSLLGGEYPT